MSHLLKSACLSSDVYKGKSTIMRSYKYFEPRYIDIKGYTSLLSIRKNNDIYIAFRGCKDIEELVSCIESKMVKPISSEKMLINYAIWNKYQGIKDIVSDVINEYDSYNLNNSDDNNERSSIILTGHSLGGALAQLSACFLNNDIIQNKNIKCVSIGSPYVGDIAYVEYTNKVLKSNIRIAAKQDIIPRIKFNINMVHSGNEIIVNSNSKVPFPLSIYDHHSSINYLKCLRNEA